MVLCAQASASSSMDDGLGLPGSPQSSVHLEESFPCASAEREETGWWHVLRPVAVRFPVH